MPERLTDARIEELLSLESKATQGEWIVSDDTCRVCREDGGEFNIDPVDGGMHGMFAGRDNPDFIAASRNSIRSLLEEVRASRKAIAAVQALELTQQSPIGPLHGAGIADGLRCAKDTMTFELARAEKEGKNR